METCYSDVVRRWVLTLLDFCWINKKGVMYNYPTLIYYQMGTNLYTIMQAARRAWRLNQVLECRNYYMGVKGTKQQAVIQLIAEKIASAACMEGKFSVDGLAAMAEGIDVEQRLAQLMAEMDETTVEGLQDMFDVANSSSEESDVYGKYKKQMTYFELMGDEALTMKKETVDMFESFSVLDDIDTFGWSLFDDIFNDIPAADTREFKPKQEKLEEAVDMITASENMSSLLEIVEINGESIGNKNISATNAHSEKPKTDTEVKLAEEALANEVSASLQKRNVKKDAKNDSAKKVENNKLSKKSQVVAMSLFDFM